MGASAIDGVRTGQARKRPVKRATFRSAGRSKYGAIATTVDGIRFHSAKEARRYGELKLLQKAGHIRHLVLQPRYLLTTDIIGGEFDGEPRELGHYVADFAYEERDNALGYDCWPRVVEDVKGFKTPLYRWKKKHVEAQYGIQIREI